MPRGFSDARYGVVRREYQVNSAGVRIKQDVTTVGTVAEAFITLPVKAKIVKFGVQSAASDCVMSTSTTFELRTTDGTKLATLVFGAHTTLGSGCATGARPETATSRTANKSMRAMVGTTVGTTGSVFFFVDWVDDPDSSVEP